MMTPAYIIRDPELIKQIGIKDFDHFSDHPKLHTDKNNALNALTGQKWRDMRSTLSPAFTGSKMN